MTTPQKEAARKIRDLLDQAEDTLNFYTVSGREGIDCSREAFDAVQQWGRSVALAAVPPAALQQGCAPCPCFSPGRSPAPGYGPMPAKLMVISDLPMGEMARGGIPFSGQEGELLARIIVAMALTPEAVYVTSMVRCPVPGNSKPDARVLAVCRPFLDKEIRKAAPSVIWVLGETAAQSFLGTGTPLQDLRGRFHDHQGVKVMPTWHPRDILSDQSLKRPVWEDVRQIMKCL